MKIQLAVIIPAYKAAHLPQALACLAAQTDQRFRVYVGDDASPEPVEVAVRQSSIPPDRLVYQRFETNLGGRSLTKQWDRCIELSHEPWIWLFSDDDEMEPGCVAAFYAQLISTEAAYDFYRFNTIEIDDRGQCTAVCPPHPEWETARAYLYFFLAGVRRATQQESIFRRATYHQLGGMIELPLGWYADTVFALACSRNWGVSTITGPLVRFRLSGQNISSRRNRSMVVPRWNALMIFIRWSQQFVADTESATAYPTNALLQSLLHGRFIKGIRNGDKWIGPDEFRHLARFMRQHFPTSWGQDRNELLKHDIRFVVGYLRNILRS